MALCEYDKDRYERVLKAGARLVAALESREQEEVLREYQGRVGRDSGHAATDDGATLGEYQGDLGHISPLNGADALVLREVRCC